MLWYAVWKTLPRSWKLCPWILLVASGPQSATSFRHFLPSCLVFYLWRWAQPKFLASFTFCPSAYRDQHMKHGQVIPKGCGASVSLSEETQLGHSVCNCSRLPAAYSGRFTHCQWSYLVTTWYLVEWKGASRLWFVLFCLSSFLSVFLFYISFLFSFSARGQESASCAC